MTTPAKAANKRPSKAAKSAAKAGKPANKKAAKSAPAKKVARAPKPPKFCLHGCGAQTKGGDFVIGHDAKLKSILQKAHVAAPDKPVDLGGKDATPLHGRKPMEIAKERGWEGFLDKAAAAAKAKADRPERQPSQKGGPVEVGVEVQVTYRGKKRTGKVEEVSGGRARVSGLTGDDLKDDERERAFGLESLKRTK